jgi:hypothetical protein
VVLPEARIAALARRLRDANITYPYLFAGPFRQDGTLPPYPFGEDGRRCFRVLREQHPDATPLPWVGGVQGKQLRLEDAGWRATAIDEVARLIDALGVDGVHLDCENSAFWPPLDPAHPLRLNRFVAELRRRLPNAFVSAVIPSTAPGVTSWKQSHSVEEVDELVSMLDQLVVIYYDTSIQDAGVFEENLAVQVDHLARWRAVAPGIQLLVGVGTFVNVPRLRRYRNLQVEGIEAHYRALRHATAQHPEQVVDGSAVYCEWTTNASRWERLRPFLT